MLVLPDIDFHKKLKLWKSIIDNIYNISGISDVVEIASEEDGLLEIDNVFSISEINDADVLEISSDEDSVIEIK